MMFMGTHEDFPDLDLLSSRFGANLKRIREIRGVSRAEVIREFEHMSGMKMYPTSLKRIEEGEQEVRLTEALVFSSIFGMRIDSLLFMKDIDVAEERNQALEKAWSARGRIVEAWQEWRKWVAELGDKTRLLTEHLDIEDAASMDYWTDYWDVESEVGLIRSIPDVEKDLLDRESEKIYKIDTFWMDEKLQSQLSQLPDEAKEVLMQALAKGSGRD